MDTYAKDKPENKRRMYQTNFDTIAMGNYGKPQMAQKVRYSPGARTCKV